MRRIGSENGGLDSWEDSKEVGFKKLWRNTNITGFDPPTLVRRVDLNEVRNPKRLRIYFMYDRSLLGKLSKCAWNVASAF